MDIFDRLEKSKFRSSFHLSNKDILYVKEKGLEIIEKHAYDFVNKRLANPMVINDGKQTPFKGHPVFVAQHATATCCRGCLYKWHNIEKDIILSQEQTLYVVSVIMKFIVKEIQR